MFGALCILLALPAFAQQTPGEQDFKISTEVDLVLLDVAVRDVVVQFDGLIDDRHLAMGLELDLERARRLYRRRAGDVDRHGVVREERNHARLDRLPTLDRTARSTCRLRTSAT